MMESCHVKCRGVANATGVCPVSGVASAVATAGGPSQ